MIEDDAPCLLCRRATDRWADLCDGCADVFQDLADALDPRNDAVSLEVTTDAVHLVREER